MSVFLACFREGKGRCRTLPRRARRRSARNVVLLEQARRDDAEGDVQRKAFCWPEEPLPMGALHDVKNDKKVGKGEIAPFKCECVKYNSRIAVLGLGGRSGSARVAPCTDGARARGGPKVHRGDTNYIRQPPEGSGVGARLRAAGYSVPATALFLGKSTFSLNVRFSSQNH